MLSLLVLLVLVLIVFQISIATGTNARVARNDVGLTLMDLAIESAFLEMGRQLIEDAEASSGQGGPGAPGGGPPPELSGASADPGAAPGGPGGGGGPTDSKNDPWASPDRSDINEVPLWVLVQDEDSKLNILGMLAPDEVEAELCFERVVRILDLCREGTDEDIDLGEAEDMAEAMRDHMRRRRDSTDWRPDLLTDDENNLDMGLPLSLREFVILEPFQRQHFMDYRDEDGNIVHSIEAFLTIWTSVGTLQDLQDGPGGEGEPGSPGTDDPGPGDPDGQGAPGQQGDGGLPGSQGDGGAQQDPQGALPSGPGTGPAAGGEPGIAVNINTAPKAVLAGLLDDRDVPIRFWDAVIEYRNEPQEEDDQLDEDEYEKDDRGNPIVPRQFFESLDTLQQIDGWDSIEPEQQQRLRQLLTVQSHSFSIYVVARRSIGDSEGDNFWEPRTIEQDIEEARALVRASRSIVWRREGDDGYELVPLQRWEELGYVPYEVLDFPEEDR